MSSAQDVDVRMKGHGLQPVFCKYSMYTQPVDTYEINTGLHYFNIYPCKHSHSPNFVVTFRFNGTKMFKTKAVKADLYPDCC